MSHNHDRFASVRDGRADVVDRCAGCELVPRLRAAQLEIGRRLEGAQQRAREDGVGPDTGGAELVPEPACLPVSLGREGAKLVRVPGGGFCVADEDKAHGAVGYPRLCETGLVEEVAGLAAAEATTAQFRAAGERADLAAYLETLAPTVRLRSPISFNARFEGFDDVSVLMREVFEVLRDIEYFEDVGTATTRALFYRARIGGQPTEGAILVRLDEGARVVEMTMFVRPLPGLTALTARLTPRLAAPLGRARFVALAAMTRPVAFLTRVGDGLGARLIQPRRR
jgi:hypothetical protein